MNLSRTLLFIFMPIVPSFCFTFFRPAKTNGLWCCTLLPAILLLNTFQYNVTPMQKLISYASVGQLFYSLLFILFVSVSCLVLQEQIYGGCIASSLCSTLLVYLFVFQGELHSYHISYATSS